MAMNDYKLYNELVAHLKAEAKQRWPRGASYGVHYTVHLGIQEPCRLVLATHKEEGALEFQRETTERDGLAWFGGKWCIIPWARAERHLLIRRLELLTAPDEETRGVGQIVQTYYKNYVVCSKCGGPKEPDISDGMEYYCPRCDE